MCSHVTPSRPSGGKWVMLVTWHASSVGSAVTWGFRTASRVSVKFGSGEKKWELNDVVWTFRCFKWQKCRWAQVLLGFEVICSVYVSYNDHLPQSFPVTEATHIPNFHKEVEQVGYNQQTRPEKHLKECNKSPTQNLCETEERLLKRRVLYCTTKWNSFMAQLSTIPKQPVMA